MLKPSGDGETLGKQLLGGDFPYGGLQAGNGPLRCQTHNVRVPGPCGPCGGLDSKSTGMCVVSWLCRPPHRSFGEGWGGPSSQQRVLFNTRTLRLHGWATHLVGMSRGIMMEKPWGNSYEVGISLTEGCRLGMAPSDVRRIM